MYVRHVKVNSTVFVVLGIIEYNGVGNGLEGFPPPILIATASCLLPQKHPTNPDSSLRNSHQSWQLSHKFPPVLAASSEISTNPGSFLRNSHQSWQLSQISSNPGSFLINSHQSWQLSQISSNPGNFIRNSQQFWQPTPRVVTIPASFLRNNNLTW